MTMRVHGGKQSLKARGEQNNHPILQWLAEDLLPGAFDTSFDNKTGPFTYTRKGSKMGYAKTGQDAKLWADDAIDINRY